MKTTLVAALAALWFAGSEARAQTLSWDTDPVTAGAQGATVSPANWLGTNFWFDGANNGAWVDNSLAVFGGSAGFVIVNGPVSVRGLIFNVHGYTISGGSTLTLSSAVIDVPDAVHVASISAPIGGTAGLVKNGAGTLALLTGNTFTGTTLINDEAG